MIYRVQRLNRDTGNWINGTAFKTEREALQNLGRRLENQTGLKSILRVVSEETVRTEVYRSEK